MSVFFSSQTIIEAINMKKKYLEQKYNNNITIIQQQRQQR